MPIPVAEWVLHQVKRVGAAAWKKHEPTSTTQKTSSHHEVVIVGGGVAGLYTAYRLLQKSDAGITDIKVLEGRPIVGGRITTQRDSDGNPLFNFGWRVGEVNTEMIALAKEIGITLIPQVTPPADLAKEGKCQDRHGCGGHVCSHTTAEREQYVVPAGRAPLSDFATACLISATAADKQDRESGYAGRTAQISWPDESHGTNAFVVEGWDGSISQTAGSSTPRGDGDDKSSCNRCVQKR